MDFDFVRMLQSSSCWHLCPTADGKRTVFGTDDPNMKVPAPPLSPLRASAGSFTIRDETAPAPVEATRSGIQAAAAPPSPMQTIQMTPAGGAAYYVNPPAYQTVGMTSSPGHGHVPTQTVMLTPQNGRMVYMQMPYFQQTALQVPQPAQRVYPQPQGPYYSTHVVQMSPDGQIIQPVTSQGPYRVPQATPARGSASTAPTAGVVSQQNLQAAPQVEAFDQPSGGISIARGAQLPEGTPFIPYGVHPTRCYTNTQEKGVVSPRGGLHRAVWQVPTATVPTTTTTTALERPVGDGSAMMAKGHTITSADPFQFSAGLTKSLETKGTLTGTTDEGVNNISEILLFKHNTYASAAMEPQ